MSNNMLLVEKLAFSNPVAQNFNSRSLLTHTCCQYGGQAPTCVLRGPSALRETRRARTRSRTGAFTISMMAKHSMPVSPPSVPSEMTVSTAAGKMSMDMLVDILTRLATLDARIKRLKCPFWRRRFGDALSALSQIVQWAIRTRHKSLTLPEFLTSTSCPVNDKPKFTSLDLSTRMSIIKDDFLKRQYYVTGRLSTQLYRDDCLFNGPDPDGRVRGTRKFVDAAAGLFDARKSKVDLIDIYEQKESDNGSEIIVAHWRLEGALMLPWRPRIKPYVGSTTYKFDADGLVEEHLESWDISVVDAFLSVVFNGYGSPPAPPIDALRRSRQACGVQQWHPSNISVQ